MIIMQNLPNLNFILGDFHSSGEKVLHTNNFCEGGFWFSAGTVCPVPAIRMHHKWSAYNLHLDTQDIEELTASSNSSFWIWRGLSE